MYFEYILNESKFFEPIDTYEPEKKWLHLAKKILGDKWTIDRRSHWFVAKKKDAELTAAQGFKIHISPDIRRLTEQLATAVEILNRYDVTFKFVVDQRVLELTNSKIFPRTASGKFITIYPKNTAIFLALSKDLERALEDHVGPYILTDQPVPHSKCVFYRYGAFKGFRSVDSSGRIIHAIEDPSGNAVEDAREPEFRLPHWVEDPFQKSIAPAEPEDNESSDLLGGRFSIEEAIQFSNIGGVYKGTDTHTGVAVVIKEARPHTGARQFERSFTDGATALDNEYEKLKLLESLNVTPKPITLLEECGHKFLVQEFIDAPDLINYFSQDEISLIPFTPGQRDVRPFLSAFIPLALNAVTTLQAIHDAGVVLGDLSVNNILIDTGSKRIYFIDLESSIADHELSDWRRTYHTPGFIATDRRKRDRPTRSDDWFALGRCFCASILPVQGIMDVSSTPESKVVDTLVNDTGLPPEIKQVIDSLLHNKPIEASKILTKVSKLLARNQISNKVDVDDCEAKGSPIQASGVKLAKSIATFINRQYRGATAPMIWPGSPEAMQTSKWGLAYGAGGIAFFLDKMKEKLPDELAQALLRSEPLHDPLDASLYTGLSGIAYWLVTRGSVDEGLLALEKARISPQRKRNPCVFSGEAGVGIAALSIHRLTGSSKAWDVAADSAQYLYESCKQDDSGKIYWHNPQLPDAIYTGYSHGSAGIAFFLGQFGLANGDDRLINLSVKALASILDDAKINSHGQIYVGAHDKDIGRASYWANGSAGIGAVLVRLGHQLSNNDLLDKGVELLDSSFVKYAVLTSQFDGLTGIWDSMIDGALLTGNSKLTQHSHAIASGIGLYVYNDGEGGACFPGTQNLRLCCDFANGSAGVGLAALRYEMHGARSFFDFALPSSELFRGNP